MAIDQYGPKGAPQFLSDSRPDTAVDLTALGEFAAKVGNRRVGTQAQRQALSSATDAPEQRSLGLEFYESDTALSYLLRSAGWSQVMKAGFKALAPGALGGAFPATSADPLIRIGHGRFAPLGSSGQGTLTFAEAFPTRCALVLAITLDGHDTNPVISSGQLSKDGAVLVWSGGAGKTVQYLYLAIGF